jgi:hypothetical protein
MVPALLGFLGGLLAVALKGWVDYALAARRERKPLRAALRLLADEASDAHAGIQQLLKRGEWDAVPVATTWPENRVLLASHLDELGWPLAINIHLRIEFFNALAVAHERGQLVTEDERRELEDIQEGLVQRGRELQTLAGDSGPL